MRRRGREGREREKGRVRYREMVRKRVGEMMTEIDRGNEGKRE